MGEDSSFYHGLNFLYVLAIFFSLNDPFSLRFLEQSLRSMYNDERKKFEVHFSNKRKLCGRKVPYIIEDL